MNSRGTHNEELEESYRQMLARRYDGGMGLQERAA